MGILWTCVRWEELLQILALVIDLGVEDVEVIYILATIVS